MRGDAGGCGRYVKPSQEKNPTSKGSPTAEHSFARHAIMCARQQRNYSSAPERKRPILPRSVPCTTPPSRATQTTTIGTTCSGFCPPAHMPAPHKATVKRRTLEPALRAQTCRISPYLPIPPSDANSCSVTCGPTLLSSASCAVAQAKQRRKGAVSYPWGRKIYPGVWDIAPAVPGLKGQGASQDCGSTVWLALADGTLTFQQVDRLRAGLKRS